jgi:hypothetical protein
MSGAIMSEGGTNPMSSAILYLAIVAIWACVLIPRWLKRDSARGAAAPAPLESPVPAAPETTAADGYSAEGPELTDDELARLAQPAVAADEPDRMAESRRRMLAARRRLLLMLIGLEIAALTLAFTGLAAVWVVIPPSVMLIGYLLLLREAAQADAEQALRDAEAAERARARSPRAQRAAAAQDTSSADMAAAPAALAARFAAAPVAADYEDAGPGRDFAPGLAGKYTASNADTDAADEDYYDSYEPPRLRAVGD